MMIPFLLLTQNISKKLMKDFLTTSSTSFFKI